MGTSVTHTKSATWLVAPPDTGADVGEVVAGYLAAIGERRGPALVREVVGRTVEAARRAAATGADLAAAVVAAILDAVGAAATAGHDSGAHAGPAMPASLRRHLERGAAVSATPEVAARWVPRIVGSVEGIVEQCGEDAEHVALVAAAMMIVDVGGGLENRFGCVAHGAALVAAIEAVAGDTTSCEALGGMRAVVEANAAFERAVDLADAGDATAAIDALRRARSRFLEAGLRVEASVGLVEQARIESEAESDIDVDAALGHYSDARAVLAELGREVEVARADRDLAFAVSRRSGPDPASALVDAAAEVFGGHGLAQDLVLCDVVRACLARTSGHHRTTELYLNSAADRLHALGLEDRAAHLRALAAQETLHRDRGPRH